MSATLKNVVGLFGTCGKSTWREPVMAQLQPEGIEFFNPVVPHWTPECAAAEAEHLAQDKVVVFVITGEEESPGSLAETGWLALSAFRNGQTALFVVEDFADGNPKSPSNRARKLVRAHADKAGVKIYASVAEVTAAAIQAMKV